jgi:dGTPase
MLDLLVGDLIRNTQARIAAAGIKSLEDVRTCPDRLVSFSPTVDQARREAKDFLYSRLYFSVALDPEKNDAERIIGELFTLWTKQPDQLPYSYREKARQEPLPRVVCDYIAGMTDSYIYEQYEKHRKG